MRITSFPAAGLAAGLWLALAPLAMAEEGAAEQAAPPTAPPLILSAETMEWAPQIGRYLAPAPDRGALEELPILAPWVDIPAARVLRRLVAQGTAGGLAGVIYDNRDRSHSRMNSQDFPQLTTTNYAEDLRGRNLDTGLAGPILFPGPTIGNSSTAIIGGRAPRSLARYAMTSRDGPPRAWQEYTTNHLYAYPEHRDHDAVDLYPANWPYMLISQGSSYSDRPFLWALAATLAAFPAETRARLEAAGLVAPTLQMILRRSLGTVRTPAAYLTGAAHPTAFARGELAADRMVALAGAMAPDAIPPLVVLTIEGENFRPRAGLADMTERLIDTPAAIARIWRGWEGEKDMILSAARTRDPNGRELTFDWVLLRGDADRVQITPLDAAGRRARITLQWHDRRPVGLRQDRLTDRVDIGVFAHNGVHHSAPSFVSVSFPTHQVREHATGPDGRPRLVSVDYDAAGREVRFDPVLHWTAPWRDALTHDDQGRVTGWTRHLADGGTEVFDSPATGNAHEVFRARNRPPTLRMIAPD